MDNLANHSRKTKDRLHKLFYQHKVYCHNTFSGNNGLFSGMIEFRDTLTGLIDEFGQVEEDPFELPKPAVIGDKKTKQVSDSPTVSEPILFFR